MGIGFTWAGKLLLLPPVNSPKSKSLRPRGRAVGARSRTPRASHRTGTIQCLIAPSRVEPSSPASTRTRRQLTPPLGVWRGQCNGCSPGKVSSGIRPNADKEPEAAVRAEEEEPGAVLAQSTGCGTANTALPLLSEPLAVRAP